MTIKPIAVRAARMLDVRAGVYRSDVVVVVQGGRIESVGSNVPTDSVVVDLGQRTLLPGLIDVHTHVLLHSNRMRDVTPQDNLTYMILQEYPAHRVARAVRNLRIALMNGFTSIRDCGTEGAAYDDVGLRDAVNEGVIPGPRMQVAGPALSPTGSYPILHYRPDWTFPTGVGTCDGPDGCRKAVRQQASYGTNWMKVYATMGYGTGMTPDGYIDSPPNWTKEELQAIVDEAHARGLRVAAHATTITGTQMAIDAGVESIEHAHAIRPEMAERIAEKGIFIVPTLTTSLNTAAGLAGPVPPIWREIPDVQARSLANCHQAGVKIAFGTDAGSGSIPWTQLNQAVEFRRQVDLGLSPVEAIRSATVVAAELLTMEGKAGLICEGAYADLIALSGDPLNDVTSLETLDFVMKNGEVIRSPNPADVPTTSHSGHAVLRGGAPNVNDHDDD